MKLLFSLIFLILPVTGLAQSGWQPLNRILPYGKLDIVSDSVWVSLQGNTIYFTNDQGIHWQKKNTFSNYTPSDGFQTDDIHFVSLTRGFVVAQKFHSGTPSSGFDDLLELSTADGGSNWSEKTVGILQGNGIILGQNETDWFIADGYPTRQVISGATASPYYFDVRGPVYSTPVYTINFHDSLGLAVSIPRFAEIIRSTNGGKSWSKISDTLPLPQVLNLKIIPVSPNTWYLSSGNELLRSTDSGTTWGVWKILPSTIRDLFIYHTGVGYLVIDNTDYVYRTIDSGSTWTIQSAGADHLESLRILNDSIAYLNSASGLLRTSEVKATSTSILSLKREIDFGVIPINSPSTQSIWLHNLGDSLLSVKNVTATDPRLRIQPTSFGILPHDSTLLQISLTPFDGSTVLDQVTLECNTSIRFERLTVRGRGKAPQLQFLSSSVDFGTTKIGETQIKHLQIANIGTDTLIINNIAFTGSQITMYSSMKKIAPNIVGTFAFAYTPLAADSIRSYAIFSENLSKFDTIPLKGIGVTSREVGIHQDWVQTYRAVGDTMDHAANAVAPQGGGAAIIGTANDPQDSGDVIVRYSSDGQMNTPVYFQPALTGRTQNFFLQNDGLDGLYAVMHYDFNQELAGVTHMTSGGVFDWEDTIRNGNPIQAATLSDHSLALLMNGFRIVGSWQTSADLGQIGIIEYRVNGNKYLDARLNGSGNHYARGGSFKGLDYATGLVVDRLDRADISAVEDDGQTPSQGFGDVSDYYGRIIRIPDGTVYENKIYHDQRAIALDSNQNVIVAVVYLDSLYLEKIDPNGSLLWRQSVIVSNGMVDSIHLASDIQNNITLVLTTDHVLIYQFDSSGIMRWSNEFFGLADLKDVPLKLLTDTKSNAYVLISSPDTIGHDYILLKYDASGNQSWRIRYSGEHGGESIPNDVVRTRDGAFYISGSTIGNIGKSEMTLVKYSEHRSTVSSRSVSNTFTIVPNPSHGVRSIYLQKQPQEVVMLEIFDLLGRVILRDRTSQNIYHVTNVLHSGCYHVRVIHPNGEQASGKMIVE